MSVSTRLGGGTAGGGVDRSLLAFQMGTGGGTPGLQMELSQMDTWHFDTWPSDGTPQIDPWRRDIEGFHTHSDGALGRFREGLVCSLVVTFPPRKRNHSLLELTYCFSLLSIRYTLYVYVLSTRRGKPL